MRFKNWDITKLAGPVKGQYFDCYVMIDIYSRYIVGAHVHAYESGPLAVEMMKEIFGIHGIPQVVHADRGTSMTSKTVAALLSDLNVTPAEGLPVADLLTAQGYMWLIVEWDERAVLPATVLSEFRGLWRIASLGSASGRVTQNSVDSSIRTPCTAKAPHAPLLFPHTHGQQEPRARLHTPT